MGVVDSGSNAIHIYSCWSCENQGVKPFLLGSQGLLMMPDPDKVTRI